MENRKEYVQVIAYRGEWSVKVNNDISIKFIYALTPNALSEVKNNTKLPIKLNSEIFSSYRQIRVLARLKKFEESFKNSFQKETGITEAAKESGINYSYVLLSSYFSIYEMLRGQGPWLILVNGKWEKLENINKACDILFDKFFISTNYKNQKSNSKQFGKTLISFINKLVFKYYVKEKSFWITGSSFNKLKENSSYLMKMNKNYSSLYIINPDRYSFIRSIHSFLKLIKDPKSRETSIGIVPLKDNSKNYIKEIAKSLKIFENIISNNTIITLINSINNCMAESEAYVNYLDNLFLKYKPSFIIADQLRWLSSTNISLASQKNNIPVYLLSHGSHTKGKDIPSKLALNRLSDGMLISNLANKIVLQSPLAFEATKNSVNKSDKIFVKPVMWGFDIEKQKDENRSEFTILHAGTYKLLGGRVWIYETSNEFLSGLINLAHSISNSENIKLIIRIREEPKECDINAIKNLLPKSNKWELSLTKTFKDDLKRSDMLVSYSSTTIEEALNFRKPVGIYGGTLRYRHVRQAKRKNLRTPVYHLTHKNLKREIINIKRLHHNQPLTDTELNGYIWNNATMSKKQFLSNLVS